MRSNKIKYDTKNTEDIKCLTTFQEYKDEVNQGIYYNKEQMKKDVEFQNKEIEKLEAEIKTHKAKIEDLKRISRSSRRISRASLNKPSYKKRVEEGLIEMKKFVKENPEFAKGLDKEVV